MEASPEIPPQPPKWTPVNSDLTLPPIMPQPYTPSTPSGSTTSKTNRPSRFISDMNPEGMFIEAADSTGSTRANDPKADIGLWVSSGPSATSSSQFITARPPQVMDRFLLPFVRENCLTCLPPEQDFVKLRAIFIKKVHPIFPVVPLEALSANPNEPTNIVLRQIVCLAASSDPDSLPFLHLSNRGSELIPPLEFSQSISSAVRAILETSIVADRVVHIRALSMLSLYTQATCAEEEDLPAQLGGRAIHHVQTLGLHLLKSDSPNFDNLENLFCATWALDRLNACMYGRPLIFHERDLGVDLEASIKRRQPCFRLFLRVIQWLDQVIELYRPKISQEASGLTKVAYIDLPVLEGMIVEAEALNVPSYLIGKLASFSPICSKV